jgi:hypothetical protein
MIAVSCKKADNPISASMSAKINGALWNTSVRVTVLQGGFFSITGTSLAGEIMNITIYGQTEGTYLLQAIPPAFQFTALYKESASILDENGFAATSGQVVITHIDNTAKKISGTFNFDAMRASDFSTISVTEGKFNNLLYTGK